MSRAPRSVDDFIVECYQAPGVESLFAGPIRWANALRSDQTYWVTLSGPGPFPEFRVSIADEEKARHFAEQLARNIRVGWVVPRTSLWRRLLPKVDRGEAVVG
jgi:hypothetical protein